MSRIDSNVFGVFGRESNGHARIAMGRNVDLVGHGVYLGASMFNHSCSPNCSVTSGVHALRVVVDEPVEAGTELQIAYCDVQQPVTSRRRLLRRHYHFDCCCERCVAEASGAPRPKLSYGGGGGGPPKDTLTKRERRERREQRTATRGGGTPRPASGPQADGDTVVSVAVDLRVLLKLAKAPQLAGRGQLGGAEVEGIHRSKKAGKANKQRPVTVPVCCVGLRLVRVQAEAEV